MFLLLTFLTAMYQKYLFPDLIATSTIILLSIPTASILVLILSHFYYRSHLLTRCLSSSSASIYPKWSATRTPEYFLTIILIRASLSFRGQGGPLQQRSPAFQTSQTTVAGHHCTTASGNLLGKNLYSQVLLL